MNTQTTYRDLESQTKLLRVVSEISRTIDRRRSRELNFNQIAKIDFHSEIQKLKTALNEIKTKRNRIKHSRSADKELLDKINKVRRQLKNTRKRHQRRYLDDLIKRFNTEQSIIDIQRQFKELKIKKKQSLEIKQYSLTKRKKVIDALYT